MYYYAVYFYDILETGSANTDSISRHSRDRFYEYKVHAEVLHLLKSAEKEKKLLKIS